MPEMILWLFCVIPENVKNAAGKIKPKPSAPQLKPRFLNFTFVGGRVTRPKKMRKKGKQPKPGNKTLEERCWDMEREESQEQRTPFGDCFLEDWPVPSACNTSAAIGCTTVCLADWMARYTASTASKVSRIRLLKFKKKIVLAFFKQECFGLREEKSPTGQPKARTIP